MNGLYKYLVVFCTLVMISISSSVFANFIVATLDQVVVTPEGLFVELDGALQVVDSVTIANDGYVVAIPHPQAWYCRTCGNHVPYPLKKCSSCGNPNPRDRG